MATSPSARRRQRSTRLTVAAVLLGTAAFLVLAAALDNVAWLRTVAGLAAVALGAAATRITHTEVMQSRRETNQVRAEQALAFQRLSAERAADTTRFITGMNATLAERDTAIRTLQDELAAAQRRVAETTASLAGQTRRAEEGEQRAAEAILRVAELEGEIETLRAEYDAWLAQAAQGMRRHA